MKTKIVEKVILLESPIGWKDYELLDSGEFEKLERFGEYILIRPEPKALWKRSMSAAEWSRMAHTKFTTGAGFGKAGKEDSEPGTDSKKWMISGLLNTGKDLCDSP